MIIYFWRKSKKQAFKWGIGALILATELYMSYIWSKILLRENRTIQIIRPENTIQAQNIQKESDLIQQSKIGEYSFVASKRGKYYYPSNCNKAQSLSIKNMLYFKDKMSAEGAGFVEYLQCN